MSQRPVQIRVTSQEEGMPHGQVFAVIGWTGFDQAVVRGERDDCLLVLQPDAFEPVPVPFRAAGEMSLAE